MKNTKDEIYAVGSKIRGHAKDVTLKLGDELCIELELPESDYRVVIPQSELDIIYQPRITEYFGKDVTALIKDVDDKNKIILGSRKANLERKRDRLIEELQTGKTIDATVYKVAAFGCYLRYMDVPLILRNKDFSTDFTPVIDVLKRGNVITCKLVEVSPTKRIFVQPEPKFASDKEERTFEVGQKLVGPITTITGFGYFVRIGAGIDVLCPIDGFEFNKQDKVVIELKQVKEDGRIRGKILRKYEEEEQVTFTLDMLPE